MNKHINMLSRIFNTPLAIVQDKLDIISSQIGIRLLTNQELSALDDSSTKKSVSSTTGTHIIPVFDTLVAKGGFGASGFTSYEGIRGSVEDILSKSGVSRLGFHIDSPGGEVNGLFNLTDFIASIPATYGIETFTVIDGLGTSAAYAIASATQKVYATPTSIAGSIGVIMSLVDQTKFDENIGVTYHILRSKDEKALGNPHEKVTPRILEKFQTILMEFDDIFNKNVVQYRQGLTIEAIKETKGNSYVASEALTLNLIDGIVSSIDEVVDRKHTSTIDSTPPSISLNTIEGSMKTLEELTAEVAALQEQLVSAKADSTVMKAAATQAGLDATNDERVRCLSIIEAGAVHHIKQDQIVSRIKKGTSAEDSTEIFTAVAEIVDSTTAISTEQPAASTIPVVTPNTSNRQVEIGGETISVAGIMNYGKGQ